MRVFLAEILFTRQIKVGNKYKQYTYLSEAVINEDDLNNLSNYTRERIFKQEKIRELWHNAQYEINVLQEIN